jgi:CelD/BcsL family acetyltransferase involved in cellulose biosynthesis
MLTAQPAQLDLTIQRIGDAGELQSLQRDWNRLAGDVPFRRFEWLEAWWRCYWQPGMELFVLALRDPAGELVALAPWYARRSALWGRVLSFLGSGQVCSDYLTVLAAPEYEAATGCALADWLAGDARRAWDLIELDGMEPEDPVLQRLVAELALRGHVVHQRERIGAWRLELPGDWKSYESRLSKSRRGGVRTLEKRYFQTGRAVLRTADTAEAVERGLKILHELHQKRRKSLGDPGCFASPRFANFLALAATRFHQLGRLRLQWIELDGRPAAAEFDLSSADTVYHYQSGMDPDAAQDKPGWLMQISALREAIDQGFRAFDFLRGDEPYKSWWRAERRPLAEIRVVGRSATARLRHRVWTAAACLKAWQRRAKERLRRKSVS